MQIYQFLLRVKLSGARVQRSGASRKLQCSESGLRIGHQEQSSQGREARSAANGAELRSATMRSDADVKRNLVC